MIFQKMRKRKYDQFLITNEFDASALFGSIKTFCQTKTRFGSKIFINIILPPRICVKRSDFETFFPNYILENI